jgi:F-type H+-transporting ATPase subunit b
MSSVLPPDVPTPVEAPVGVGATHTSTAEPTHGPEEAGGLPQFEFQHWGGQIVYLLFLFALLYLLIAKVFAPRMRRIFDERASTIATAIETARQVQAEAAGQAEAARREVDEARAGARATAAAAKARVTDEANRRAAAEEAVVSARISEAETAIGKTRDAAMTNVSTIATDTAAAIVERLTGVGVTKAEAAAAVKGV